MNKNTTKTLDSNRITNTIQLNKIKSSAWKKYFSIAGILLLTVLVYLRVFQNQFTNWDDDIYVLGNPYIKSLRFTNISAIFSNYFCGNYHPFSMLCYALGYQIGGYSPWPYQLINLSLHLGNTFLIFWLIRCLLKRSGFSEVSVRTISLMSALLFGIHTLNVESVAWMSENKNVLYTFFFLSSIIGYIRYTESRKASYFLCSLLLFVFSLLSKGTAVSLSVTLIAVDLFLGRKITEKKVVLEKIPFFALSLAFGIIAVYAQRSTASVLEKGTFSVFERISFASYGFIQYLIKLILPVRLSALYPYPDKIAGGIPSYFYLFPFLLSGGLVLWIMKIRKSAVYLFGTLFFLINVFLVLQLIPVGDAYMADRYVYVPSIGFFLILAAFYQKLQDKKQFGKMTLQIITGTWVTLLVVLSFHRIGVWKDSLTLWEDVLSKHTNNPKAWNNRGVAYSMTEDYQKAIADYNKALQIKPDFKEPYMNRGSALQFIGKYQEALYDFNKLAVMDPNNAYVYNNRGTLYSTMENLQSALQDYNKAISIVNTNALFYSNRAELKTKLFLYQSAIADCDTALQIDPEYLGAYNIRAIAKKGLKEYQSALNDFNKALEIDPGYADAIYNRGNLYKEMGNEKAAGEDYSKAASMGKSSDEALVLRGLQKMQENNLSGALDDFNSALSISPSYAGYMNRGVLYTNIGKFNEAIADYNRAIEIEPNSSLAYMNRCNARINTKEYQEALADINKSISLDPGNGTAYINRGIVKVCLADYTGAIDDLTLALKTSENPTAYYYRGLAKINSGHNQSGCQDIQKSKSLGYTQIDPAVARICK